MTNDKLPAPPAPQFRPSKQGGSDSGGIIKIALISLVCALVVVIGYGVVIGGYVNKKLANATYVNVTQLTALQTDINTAKASLDTAIVGLPTTVSSQVNSIISSVTNRIGEVENGISNVQSQINSLQNNYNSEQNSISQINSDIIQLESDVASVKTQIGEIIESIRELNTEYATQLTDINDKLVDHETRLDNLEATPTPTTTVPSANIVNITLKQQSSYLTTYITTSENVSIAYMRVTVTNNSGNDIENVIIGLGFDIGYGIVPTISSVSGGTLGWVQYPYSTMFWTTAGWGYTIKANDKITFDVVAKFSNSSGNIGTPQYEATASVESWDYK